MIKLKVSKDVRKWNKTIYFYKQSDNWICSSFDYKSGAWNLITMPWGWSRFGAKKIDTKDLKFLIQDLENLIKKDIDIKGINTLKEYGIVY